MLLSYEPTVMVSILKFQLVKQFLTENIHSEGSGLESRQSQLYIGKSEVCAHVCV